MRKNLGMQLGAAIGWPGLAWCWWLVVADGDAPTASMVAIPVMLAALTIVVTTWWVRHNRAIYRRKGPRRAVTASATPYLTDRRARPLRYDPTQVKSAREVVVRVTAEGVKRYEVVA
jgi:hypothetical protein